MKLDLQHIANEVIKIAQRTGEFIRFEGQKFDRSKIQEKGLNNLVSYVDMEAEKMIVQTLKFTLPDAGFITEEGTESGKADVYNWVMDSLDVTTSDNPLRPEESENIEVGLKGDFFADRLRLQLSAFSMDIEGRQRTVDSRPPEQNQPLPLVISGDQSFDGVEIVMNWLISDTVQLSFLTTFRDTESTWDSFYNAEGELVTETSSGNTYTDYTMTFGWQPNIGRGRSIDFM